MTKEDRQAWMREVRKLAPRSPRLGIRGEKHGPRITMKRFKRALKNTGGHVPRIAEKLGVRAVSLHMWIGRHPEARPFIEQEELSRLDDAEDTIEFWIKDRENPQNSSQTARWFLESKKPQQYRKKQEITLEGGEKPLNVVDLSQLNLPLEIRKQILQQIESGDTGEDDENPQNSRPKITIQVD